MSALIFYIDKEQILVATDTLAVNQDGKPQFFTSKSIYIPHLRTIICGTGLAGFSNEWALNVINNFVVQGIQNLDFHTPKALSELWDKQNISENLTTTVYHFGFSEENDDAIGFAYRSENNFISEKIGYGGTGVKPNCEIIEGNLFETIPLMMFEQRKNQESLPNNERVYIGGEIYSIHLTKKTCVTEKLSEFFDYKKSLIHILNNFS